MWSSRTNSVGRLRAGSGPLDHKDDSASLDRGAILLVVLGRSPTTDSAKKNIVIGPKRKPSSGWAVELRRFFVNVLALYFCIVFCIVCSVFCEHAGSVFLHRLKSIDIA